jgi:diguanylate cyclase (GGDEF)-like protein
LSRLRKINDAGFLILAIMMFFSIFFFTNALDMPDISLVDKDVISFSDDWTWQNNGYQEKFQLPYYFDVDKSEPLVIRNTIPDHLPNGAKLVFKSYMQSVIAKIDGETVYTVGHDSDKFLGKDFASFWAAIDINPEHKGKIIELTLFSNLPSSKGYASEIFITSGTGLLAHIFSVKGLWNVLSLAIIVLGFILIINCFLARIYKERRRGLLFLGITALLMGSWFLGDSGILQFLTNNTYYVTRITFISTLLSPISFGLYLRESLSMEKKRFLADFFTLLLIVNAAICMVLEYLDILSLRDTITTSAVLIAIFCIYYMAVFLIEAFYYKDKRASNEVKAIFIYMFFGTAEIIHFYLNKQKGASHFMLVGATIYIIIALFNQHRDYSERRKIKEEKEYFEKIAYTDVLTGGYNRARYVRDLKNIADPKGFAIIQADTDRLKYINDYFGHSHGDLAIIDTYKVLHKNFAKIGDTYRIGGDEFSVIVSNANRDEIDRIIEQVKKDVALIAEEREYDYSVSFGVVKYDSSLDKDINAAIVRADHKMYDDKKRLRNTVPQKMPAV